MTSPAKIAASRRNGQKSSGPKSAAGKRRSSANALRHGLCSTRVLMPGENPAAYEAFARRTRRHLAPVGADEEATCHRLIDLSWRLQRAEQLEADTDQALDAVPDFLRGLERLMLIKRYRKRLSLQVRRAYEELLRLRTASARVNTASAAGRV